MNDSSSSAKTMDEKELFFNKNCSLCYFNFSIMNLEEVKDADAEGLKVALQKSLEKLSLTKERKLQEICMCTDGAPVNVRMHELVKEELGDIINLYYVWHINLNLLYMMLLKLCH